MRIRLILVAALLAVVVLLVATTGSASVQAPPPIKVEPQSTYAEKHGCDHSHRSRVANRRVTALLRNHEPSVDRAKLHHYQTCVTTKRKARAVQRLIVEGWRWRIAYPQVYAIKYNRYPTTIQAHLTSIAACESHGSPTAIGGGGLYRGKYQFSYSTWASVGGRGDPATTHEWEQDYRAAILLTTGGAGHWPVCG